MDIQRMLLVVIFGMSAFFLWTEWQKFANPPAPATPATIPGASAPAGSGTASVPAPPAASTVPAAPAASATVPAAPTNAAPLAGQRITLETDLLRLVVNTAGGVIEEADLKTQQGTVDKSKPYQLLLNTKDRLHVVQTGLIGEGMPNHRTVYVAEPG